MADSIRLDIRFQQVVQPALSIPLDAFPRFAPLKPAAWLAYLGFAVAGALGTLRHGPALDAPPVDLNDPNSVDVSRADDYCYHLGDEYNPADPDLGLASITGSDVSARGRSFKHNIVARDERCVVTGFENYCQSAHLIRRTLGDEYIRGVTTLRRGTTGDPIIEDVDDIRNGLLVNTILHIALGRNDAAILPIPNPHMQSDSVPEPGVTAYYLHVFHRASEAEQPHNLPHNRQLRTPPDLTQWPTQTIFAFIYAAAVLKSWGIDHYLGTIRAQYGSKFYSPNIASNREERKKMADRTAEREWDEQELFMWNLLSLQQRIREVMTDPVRKAEAEAERTRQEERMAAEKVREWMEHIV